MKKTDKQVEQVKKVKTKRIIIRKGRNLKTEYMFIFRKDKQKKRKTRVKRNKAKNPVLHVKLEVTDGFVNLGEVNDSKNGNLLVFGKGNKGDAERGRCVVWIINPTKANEDDSNIIVERSR